jgi:D-glucuronyl C5-epimerase C-terminus
LNLCKILLYKAYHHFFVSEEQFIAETVNIFGDEIDHYSVHPCIEFLRKEIVENFIFDSNGIPCTTFPGSKETKYNPVSIAQYALGLWEIFLSDSKDKLLKKFLKISDWFVENQVDGGWQYHYHDKISNLKTGWISAMAQGQDISVLIRAFQISGNKKYLDCAEQAIKPLEKSISEGGVVHKFDEHNWWFEEYPSPQNPGHVFNGHIYCLFGIWDLYRVSKYDKTLELFNKGVNALITQIQHYDTGYWVTYDQKFRDLINAPYLDLQIRQLEVINTIREDSILSEYISRWKKYQRNEKSLFKLTCKRFAQKYLKGNLK